MTVGRALSLSKTLLAVCAGVGAVGGWLGLRAAPANILWSAVWTLPILSAPSLIAGWLSIHVARDYPGGSAMRKSWLLIGSSACAVGVSQAINFGSYIARLEGRGGEWVGFRQHANLVSIVLLFVALFFMWQSFARLGFGLSLRAGDQLTMLAIGAAAVMFLAFYQDMPDSRSKAFLVRSLQFANPLLLAALAVLGVLLRRISLEIGEGQLARSLRYLLLMLMARLLVIALGIVPVAHNNTLFSMARSAMMWSVPALFLLAVVERWKLIHAATEIANHPEDAIPADFVR